MLAVIYKKPMFLKTLKYVLGKSDAVIITKNMAGDEPHILNQQFIDNKNTNYRVKRHCAHLILSFPKHESIDDLTMAYITNDFLESMGYRNPDDITQNVPFVAVRHQDREHEHIHIVASRIKFDGNVVSDSWDYLKAQSVTRTIAAKYNLSIAPVSSNAIARDLSHHSSVEATVSYNRSPSIRQLKADRKKPSFKQIIAKAIEDALSSSSNVTEYAYSLYRHGVVTSAKFDGQELLGFSYAYQGKYVAGNQISRRYSWNNIKATWRVDYQFVLDYAPLKRVGDVAIEYKGEELPELEIARISPDVQPPVSSHARFYAEMKAMLKKKPLPSSNKEQTPSSVEDNVVERFSSDEVEQPRERLNQDKQVRQHRRNKDVELD